MSVSLVDVLVVLSYVTAVVVETVEQNGLSAPKSQATTFWRRRNPNERFLAQSLFILIAVIPGEGWSGMEGCANHGSP